MAMITCVVSCACMGLTAVTTTFKWKLQSVASSFGDNRAPNEKKPKKLKCSSSAYLSFALFYLLFSFFTLILRPGTWLFFLYAQCLHLKLFQENESLFLIFLPNALASLGIKFLYLISWASAADPLYFNRT